MPCAVPASAVVELRAHGVQSPSRDAVGAAFLRGDQPALPQPPEREKRAVAQYPAFPRDAGDFRDFSLFVLFNENVAAARERMQRPLFELRDIHG